MENLIGKRVKFNNLVANAFEGQTGEIEEERDSFLGHLYIVKLDNPTPPASNWSVIEKLGVNKECFELI